MSPSSSRHHASFATFLVTAVIIHGSLWPYDFRAQSGPFGPLEAFLATWAAQPSGRGDLIANILLYVPFGVCGTLTIHFGAGSRFLLVTSAGALLSASMELLQFYEPERISCMSDLYLNTAGTAFGAGIAILVGCGSQLPLLGRVAGNPVPSSLIVAMLGDRLFPYVPTIDLHKYWVALKPVLASPSFATDQIFRYIAVWSTASELTAAIFGSRLSLLLQPLLIGFVLAGKILIVGSVVTLSEIVAASLTALLWPFLVRLGVRRTAVVALVLLASIVVERLRPFEFELVPREFGWLPFRAFLGGSMAVNTTSFLEKVFLYGSLLWLSSRAGLKAGVATVLVAIVLFGTSLAETTIPGRSAEITDTVMVLLIAALIRLVDAHRPTLDQARPTK